MLQSYEKKIEQLLYHYNGANFSSVTGIEFVKELAFNADDYRIISDKIKKGGIGMLETLNTETSNGEDLTFYKFVDQVGRNCLVAIYDSDELWQDPEILDVFFY